MTEESGRRPNLELGIVGVARRRMTGVLETTSFAAFQRELGQLESALPGQYLAAHAACHAFMNSIQSVCFSGVDDLGDASALRGAVRRLLEVASVKVLVVPGLIDVELSRVVVSAFEAALGHRGALWLDAPQRSSVDELLEHRDRLGGSRDRVRVATPWLDTITPGRRTHEPLPPSCLIAPLTLGRAGVLKGVHEVPEPPDPDQRERLREAGCGLFVPDGWQRKVKLAFPLCQSARVPSKIEPVSADNRGEYEDPPLLVSREHVSAETSRGYGVSDQPEVQPDWLESRVRMALRSACQKALESGARVPALWRSAERESFVVLSEFQQRGEIESFTIRCDEETNEPARLPARRSPMTSPRPPVLAAFSPGPASGEDFGIIGTPAPSPERSFASDHLIIWVNIRLPRRVRELVIKMNIIE